MSKKVKYPAWLHADMEYLQNRIFNYVYHRGANPVDRVDIQVKWEKIKAEMDTALEQMDFQASICSAENPKPKMLEPVLERSRTFVREVTQR